MLYGKFKYGGAPAVKYGASTPANLRWGLIVDWDDDGIYDSSNEAVYLTALTIERGRSSFIEEQSGGFVPPAIGRARLTLRNRNGRFNPYNTSSPLYPNVGPGKFAQIMVRDGATIYTIFTGTIQAIDASGYNQSVEMVIEDGLRWLSDQDVTTAVYQNVYADEAIGAVLDKALWPSQWGRDLGKGADIFDFWWATGRSALSEIQELANGELGRYHVKSNGQFVYHSRQASESSVLSITQAQLLDNPVIPQPWSFRRNVVKVKAHPIQMNLLGQVWSSTAVHAISPGQTIQVTAELDAAALNVISPVAYVDYYAFDQSNGSGVILSGWITATMTAEAEAAVITLTNTGSQLAYITFMQLRGNELVSATISASANGSGYDRRPRTLELDLAWQQDANNPAAFAGQMVAFLGTASPFPTVQIEQRPSVQFGADLFELVSVSLAAIGIADTYRLGYILHEWLTENGQAVRTTWSFEPRMGYNYWRFDDNAILGTSLLGW